MFLKLKQRKTVSVLVRYNTRLYEKLAVKRKHFKRDRVRAFKQKITENGQKSTVRCAVDQNNFKNRFY
jgi:hypothetical protein